MTDQRFGGQSEEDRLPWLEPVEEEQADSGPSAGKLIGAVVLGLILLGAVVGGYFWWTKPGATDGRGELIAAPAGPYKIKPDEPGGMDIEGKGDSAFAASAGAEPTARIDFGAVPEAPVTADRPRQAPRPADSPSSIAPAESAAPAAGTIQLGAFSSEAAASSAWKALSGRFSYLEPLGHNVVPVESDGRTLYRLRASGPGAANICGRLRVAGETCLNLD